MYSIFLNNNKHTTKTFQWMYTFILHTMTKELGRESDLLNSKQGPTDAILSTHFDL